MQMQKLRQENSDLRKAVMVLKKKKEKYEARSATKIKLEAYKLTTPGSPSGDRGGNDSSNESKNIVKTTIDVKKDLSNELEEEVKKPDYEDEEVKKNKEEDEDREEEKEI